MYTHVPFHWGTPHPLALPPRRATLDHDAELHLTQAFEATAAAWLIATLAFLALLGFHAIPRETIKGPVDLTVMTGGLTAAMCAAAGLLYGLPYSTGGRLWSVPLAWTHYAMLNAGAVVPVWCLHTFPAMEDLTAGWLLGAVLIVQAGGFIALLSNLLHTHATGRRGP